MVMQRGTDMKTTGGGIHEAIFASEDDLVRCSINNPKRAQ